MTRSALRGGLYAVGGLLAAMALLLAFAGAVVPAAWSGFWAALLILVVAFEHWRYKP
ncbi:MAG: hypothetical protein JO162_11445, partial [Alphaproteobacteria bacterium]|nr:hypothetical protein [Alphaproteobacteria bacterium]